MNLPIKQLKKEAKKIALSPEEKSEGIRALRSYMVAHPVRDGVSSRHHGWSNQPNSIFKTMPILLVIALLVTGGASVAAESSLPGDVLYPVKINVTENVKSMLALSDESEAKLHSELAAKRIEEAEALAAESRLDADVRVKIEARFKAHADRVEARIEKLEKVDAAAAAELSANFETSLKAHERILEAFKNGEIDSLILKIKAKGDSVESDRIKVEAKVKTRADVQVAAENRMKEAEHKIAEVRAFIEKHDDDLNAESKAKIDARLSLAVQAFNEGKAKLDAKAYGEAFVAFQRAHHIAQEAKLLLNAKFRFERSPKPSPSGSPSPKVSPSPSASPSVSASAQVQASTEVKTNSNSGSGSVNSETKIEIDLD